MDTISFGDFKKLDIRVGTIISAEAVESADKLLKLTVDVGEDKPRTLAAGVAQWYQPEELEGRQVPVLVNLETKTLRGIESQGMMLAATSTSLSTSSEEDGKPILLSPESNVEPGTIVR